jgi:hypothetical protein
VIMNFPKERKENLAWRASILRRCQEDMAYQEMTRELFFRNILFAFNAFYYTYDPRKRPRHQIPFATWEFQDGAILKIEEAILLGKDLVLEKSRDMGATWMVLLVYHHKWINPSGGSDFLLGSRIEDYVDKRGDMRTLFEKIRYAHNKLPQWLWPRGYVPRKHDNYMKLQNPETGAVITGESNNANFSTGGRFASAFFDEFAKWESTDESAWTAAGDATPSRIATSTPFGASGQYYKLVTDGKTKKIRLHWSLHPEKALGLSCVFPSPNEDDKSRLGKLWKPAEKLVSPWYLKECERRRKEEIRQELDIDYLGSGNPVFGDKAEASLAIYRLLPDKPKMFLKLNLEELGYETLTAEPFDWEGFLCVYEEYDRRHSYVLGVDVVEGVEGGDFAVIKVLDRVTKNFVASYFSCIDEVMLSRVIKIISDYYSPEKESTDAPWCGVETTGPGLATFDLCVLLGVVNLFMAPRYDVTNGGVSYKKGWKTDTTSRNELIAGVRKYLINRTGELYSQRLVGELTTFVYSKTGKAQAKNGAHDDEVMAAGIALQVDEIAPFDYDEQKKAKKKSLEELRETPLSELKDKDEPPTREQLCYLTAITSKSLNDYDMFYDREIW